VAALLALPRGSTFFECQKVAAFFAVKKLPFFLSIKKCLLSLSAHFPRPPLVAIREPKFTFSPVLEPKSEKRAPAAS
jgi:hypothetical protein